MSLINLTDFSNQLPQAWSSRSLMGAHCKVLRMDETAYPDEMHPYTETLLVISGQLNLRVNGHQITVRSGELYIIPPHTSHSVDQGSYGTMIILEMPNR